ncbi:hypothetical protein [Agromyces sp. C10]|uniref:hypothetical protein n=1 Tax=Agromyces sp. C10 TaxID=2935077 RepID=UPI00200AFD1F|nr:hypothetical protein [Agromyces sp. C10]MCK8609777.1 hypothetical protein [Agromyces sp. C10]
MTLTAQVLAGLMALTLIVVGALETFFFRSAALYPIFLIDRASTMPSPSGLATSACTTC